MNLYISSDHGGYELKKRIIEFAGKESLKINDLGPYELDLNDDYPDYAIKVARAVAKDGANNLEHNALGILICRSGNGMCIAANKINGAYAALCFSKKHAEMARKHDNANILCLDSDYEGEDPIEIVKSFLNSKFEIDQERHVRRFEKVKAIED